MRAGNSKSSGPFLLYLSLLLTFGFAAGSIPTVPKLNITKYLGRWYQMYDDFAVQETFERNGVCDTADYGLFPNGSLSVRNAERVGSPKGELKKILGYAYRPDPSVQGKLVVDLQGVPFKGSYWVVLLGPDTYGPDGKYQYSVVTDDASVTLFVLARNTTEFMRKYNTQVQERLSEFGFKHFYNKPLETYQKSDCEYISITEKQID